MTTTQRLNELEVQIARLDGELLLFNERLALLESRLAVDVVFPLAYAPSVQALRVNENLSIDNPTIVCDEAME
jgi:hypothetical protein